MVHADDRKAEGVPEALGPVQPHEKGSHEARARRDPDPGQLRGSGARLIQCLRDNSVNVNEMLPGRDLGHDSAEDGVRVL